MSYKEDTIEKILKKIPTKNKGELENYLATLLEGVGLFFGNEDQARQSYAIKVNENYWRRVEENLKKSKTPFVKTASKTGFVVGLPEDQKFKLSLLYTKKSSAGSGGSEDGSGGGKTTEVLSESFFCVYNALKTKMSSSDWSKFGDQGSPSWRNFNAFKSWVTSHGIQSNLDHQLNDQEFQKYFDKHESFLGTWHPRLINQADKFHSNVLIKANKNNLKYVRADALPKSIDPYPCFAAFSEEVKRRMKFSSKIDKDKWNPADVWIYDPSSVNDMNNSFGEKAIEKFKKMVGESKTSNVIRLSKDDEVNPVSPEIMNQINDSIHDFFKQGKLFPVSLKAPSGTNIRISKINDRDSEVDQVFSMEGIDFDHGNMDVKIRFRIEYKMKSRPPEIIRGFLKSKTSKGGFRLELEIKDAGARMGTLGTENWQFIIYQTDQSGVKKLNKLRETYSRETKNMKISGVKWFGGLSYSRFNEREMRALRPYLESLYSVLNDNAEPRGIFTKKDGNFIMNKTAAGEIGLAVKGITNTGNRTAAVKHIYKFASAQGFSFGSKTIETIFKSCFHIKVW